MSTHSAPKWIPRFCVGSGPIAERISGFFVEVFAESVFESLEWSVGGIAVDRAQA